MLKQHLRMLVAALGFRWKLVVLGEHSHKIVLFHLLLNAHRFPFVNWVILSPSVGSTQRGYHTGHPTLRFFLRRKEVRFDSCLLTFNRIWYALTYRGSALSYLPNKTKIQKSFLLRQNSWKISHIRYINIPTRFKGFRVKLVSFLSFFLSQFLKRLE